MAGTSNAQPAIDSSAHVCAVVVSRIGDTLLVTPALRALRAACARLTVLAHPQRLDALRNLDFIDELDAVSKRSAWWRGLWARSSYDLAVCWGREPALARLCTRVSRRTVAFAYPELDGIGSVDLLRVTVPAESSLHAVRERALLTEAAGVTVADERLAYRVSGDEKGAAQDWLSRNVPAGSAPLIGLQPFSFPTKAHRDWPLEHFGELAHRLCDEYPRAHVIVLGDQAARVRSQAMTVGLPGRVTVATGRLALRQSAAVMQQLDLYVGVDTGPTHIAGALGIPMVALYHPRYPARNLMPLHHPACEVIEAAAGTEMRDIAVDGVHAAARGLLDRAGAR